MLLFSLISNYLNRRASSAYLSYYNIPNIYIHKSISIDKEYLIYLSNYLPRIPLLAKDIEV